MKSVLFWFCLLLLAIWAGLAFSVQFSALQWLALGVLAVALAGVIWLRLVPGWGWSGLAALALLLLGWFFTLSPSQDRDWASDVAHNVKGHVEGDRLYLQNIRDFRWAEASQPESEAWISREIDLNRLDGVDMITSVWGNPLIAHLLVSFRFTDAAPLTFSVEIRREKGETFSALGGFFRQFELSLIAAEEADILHWRAVPRGEEVRLYPLKLSNAQARELLLRYVSLGNALNAAPSWYNTATSNCTTVVWQLSKALDADLPLDPSLLFSGKLPEFLEKLGVLAGDMPLADKRARALISQRAAHVPPGADFSQAIRQGGTP